MNERKRKRTKFSVSREEVRKGLRWMPWRQVPMKDVGHCEKSRGAVNRRYIREYPNGETQWSEPPLSTVEYIDGRREPGELKHLSTQRKRENSQSSGERNGNSPNQPGLPGWGCRAGNTGRREASGMVWESQPKRVRVPYAKVERR